MITHELVPNAFTIECLPPALRVLLKLRIAVVKFPQFEFNEGTYLFNTEDAGVMYQAGFKLGRIMTPRPACNSVVLIKITDAKVRSMLEAHSARFK